MNIFTDSSFSKFHEVLDSQMKVSGLYERKCADIITEEMEGTIWQMKILGDHNLF